MTKGTVADAGSFADLLQAVRPVLPEALLDDRGWERLIARAGRISPSAVAASFGFEFRLDEREAAADLLVTVPRGGPFADALVREGVSGGGGAAAPLARFLADWKQADSSLAGAVDLAALEYDIVGKEDCPAPGVFLRSAAENGYADSGVLADAVALAAGWSEDPSERSGIARVFGALPAGASIRWAGAFPDRARAVRLLVRASGGDFGAFLADIGWKGDTAAIEMVLSESRPSGADSHVFALDIAEGRVLPGLGLELSQPEQANDGLRKTLDMMARKGWCLPAKAAALGGLAGARAERIFSRSGVFDLVYGINHVKIALPAAQHGPSAPKGYVVCSLSPLS